jgi:acetyltransferase-like isoleucine patch superfamily enzyme
MRVFYASYFQKFAGWVRFLFVRLFYSRKLQAKSWVGYLGRRNGFHILGKGRVKLKGKIAFNDNVMLFCKGNMEIGANFYVNKYASIVAHDSITIGDHVSIGQFTTMLDHDHAYHKVEGGDDIKFEGYNTAPITIGNNVWIANHCTVVRGVTIGDNVVVGANTLVHKDVPSNCVILGVPYKIVKKI